VAAVVGEEYAAACADLELPIRWHVLASSSDNGGGSVPVPAGFEWLRERLATYPAAAPPRRWRESIGGDDVLLFIYTSGTTGLPKASLIRHSRFFLAGASFVAFSGVRDDDRIYLALPIYHGTGGMVAVSMSFCTGAALVLRRKFSASAFFRECRETRATVFFYVGQLCRYLCHSPPDVQEREHSVRLAIGNGMAADVWRQLVSRFGVPSVLEFYASTEGNATMFNPFNRVGAVGYLPWAARFFYPVKLVAFDVEREAPLRDARGRCVEIMRCGQPGELVGKIVDSDPLRRFDGYTQKEASAKKVLTDAFAPGDRWFRSGDLLSRDEEGFLYFVDRIGDTFRWKGENVSTGEVAAVLHAHPAVADCNVYGVRVAGYDGRAGMAAITLREPSGPVPADLYSFLQGHLPPFAQPLFVRLLPELELTGTFKHKKADLVAQGFDPSVVSDRLFVRIDRERRFAPLTAALFASIAAGRERL
jgi:fatty-acyl-CoA synthase